VRRFKGQSVLVPVLLIQDYLWMKDYLQLDGIVFKLVPIKTPIPKNGSPLDMGQIDSDKLYSNIMKWNWETVVVMTYTTTETKRESITYRTNIARLTEN
jgi:hypothetical protein